MLKLALLVWGAFGLAGCAHVPPPPTPAQRQALQAALLTLGSEVQSAEAARLAQVAYDYPRILAQEYRLVRPPLWHNLLINLGLKKRGLCYQWAEDLAAELQAMELTSLELHWGVARPGSWREHNTVVITAERQAFTNGIVLDPWRRSGALVWQFVPRDVYPWQEGVLTWASSGATNHNVAR